MTWKTLDTPDVDNFALSCYHSRLVIVGGKSVSTNDNLNDLWTLTNKKTKPWQNTLPPMFTPRSESTAFNTRSFDPEKPEYLMVAGGVGYMNLPVSLVEVLVEGRWLSLCPLPKPCFQVRVAYHYSIVYLIGGLGSYYCEVFCKLDSLITACAQAGVGGMNAGLWKSFRSLQRVYSPASFGDKLIRVGRREDYKIHAYCPFSRSWVHVGDLPVNLSSTTALVTPSNKLVVIGRRTDLENGFKLLRASSISKYQLNR